VGKQKGFFAALPRKKPLDEEEKVSSSKKKIAEFCRKSHNYRNEEKKKRSLRGKIRTERPPSNSQPIRLLVKVFRHKTKRTRKKTKSGVEKYVFP